jgi:hypothetical protein
MASPESTSFDNFDPRDFGEPTPETRARFDYAFNRLKELAVSHRRYEVDEIIGNVDVESRFGISRDDLCPVDIYRYDQISDPLFGPHDEVYITFTLTVGDPEKFHNWKNIMGPVPLNNIHYEGVDVDIVYDAGFDDEMLYITNPRDPSISLFSEQFLSMMIDRVNNHMQAVKVGNANPTEGSLRKLTEVLEQEIAKRIIS